MLGPSGAAFDASPSLRAKFRPVSEAAPISLPDGLLGSGPRRSLWLAEALSGAAAHEHPRLVGAQAADVCIVGGGFTGLWTALELRTRDPAASVAVVEADICGAGASGRNGGFAMNWWSKFLSLRKLCGPEAALELGERSVRAVAQIGEFCEQRGLDGCFEQCGWLWAATNPSQVDAWDATLNALDAAGIAPYQALSHAEISELSGSAVHLAGIFDPTTASVQPARLARELARAARDVGVRVFERSPVRSIEADARASDGSHRTRVVTAGGAVICDQVVVALNAWAARIPEIGRGLVVVASDVIATEPAPERLEEMGLGTQVAISDSRRLVNYYRRTGDGRMVFGKGGGAVAFGGRIGANFDDPHGRADEIQRQLQRIYPTLWDVPIARRWSGPIDYSLSGVPFFVRLTATPSVLVGVGFSGDGVGPSRLAGEVLARMALEGGDGGLPKALTRVPAKPLPPEPVRYLAARTVRAAVASKERSEDHGHRASQSVRLVAALDPTSFVDRGLSR
jgi:glycine/D-amino acid oxidase-like deaminating enzyme